MLIHELIALLNKYDPNTEVAIEAGSDYPRIIKAVREDVVCAIDDHGKKYREVELPVIIIEGGRGYGETD